MARRVFYSFHYKPDNWRAAMVRNIRSIEENRPATDNGWEAVKRGGDAAIKKWIADQMKFRSCTVVLVGPNTANRKWINHEIAKSWNDAMGVVGIHIHGLEDSNGNVSQMGRSPGAEGDGAPGGDLRLRIEHLEAARRRENARRHRAGTRCAIPVPEMAYEAQP